MSGEQQKSYKVYLGGKWIETGEKIQVTNPATGEKFASVSTLNRDQVRSAFDAHRRPSPRGADSRPRSAAHFSTAWPTRCISAPMRLRA